MQSKTMQTLQAENRMLGNQLEAVQQQRVNGGGAGRNSIPLTATPSSSSSSSSSSSKQQHALEEELTRVIRQVGGAVVVSLSVLRRRASCVRACVRATLHTASALPHLMMTWLGSNT